MSEPHNVFGDVEQPIRALTAKLISEIAAFSREKGILFAVSAYGVSKNLAGFSGGNSSLDFSVVTTPPAAAELVPAKKEYRGRPGKFQCLVCIPPRGFRTKENLLAHNREKHDLTAAPTSDKQYLCKRCSAVFPNRGELQDHQRKSHGIKFGWEARKKAKKK